MSKRASYAAIPKAKPIATAPLRLKDGQSLPANVPQREAKRVLTLYSEKVVGLVNEALIRAGETRSFSVNRHTLRFLATLLVSKKLALAFRKTGAIDSANDGVDGFALYRDAINCAVRVAIAMSKRRSDGKLADVVFEAETQFGKTIIEIMAKLIYTMLYADNEAIVLVNPSRNAPHKQTTEDYDNALGLHGALYVERPNMTAADKDEAVISNVVGEANLNRMKASQMVKRARADNMILAANNAIAAGFKSITYMIDEGDEHAGSQSAVNKALKYANDPKTSIEMRIVLITATAYQFKCIDGFEVVQLRESDLSPDSTYCGTFIAGPKGRRTPFLSQTMFDEIAGLGERLANFNIAKVSKATDTDLEVIDDTVMAYSRGILAPALGLNGKPMNGGRGMMMRFGTTANSKRLKNLFEARWLAQNIVCVDFHGGNGGNGGKTASQTIDAALLDHVRDIALSAKYTPHETPSLEDRTSFAAEPTDEELAAMKKTQYIIFVHGNGRRADRFPNDCTVFIDFTRNPASAVAAEQGTMGRASGHDKPNTVVMLSEGGYAMVEAMVQYYDFLGYKAPIKSAGPNAIKITDEDGNDFVIKRKLMSRIIFDNRAPWLQTPALQNIFRQIEDAYNPLQVWEQSDKHRTVHATDVPRFLKDGWIINPKQSTGQGEAKGVRIIGKGKGRTVSLMPSSQIATLTNLHPRIHTDPNVRTSKGKTEARKRVDVYFDIFGMLAADGSLQVLLDAARAHFGDDTIDFLRPLHNSSAIINPNEPATAVQVKSDAEKNTNLVETFTNARRRLAAQNPGQINGDGEFYAAHNGAIMMTLNNLARNAEEGTRVYEDPTQRDRDRNLRHLLKPPLFFMEAKQPGERHELVRFSLNALKPFKTRAKAMGGEKMDEALTLPRPNTAYWDFTPAHQQDLVNNQIIQNAASKGGRK